MSNAVRGVLAVSLSGLVAAACVWPERADAFTIRATRKISQTSGNFSGTLKNSDELGSALGSPGDVDGDGVLDLMVGAPRDDDGSSDKGAAWVLFLNADGTVRTQQKVSSGNGNFVGGAGATEFGSAMASLGDLDGDGIGDVAVGAEQDNDGGNNRGAVWILLLNANGSVKSSVKISSLSGGFAGVLGDGDAFGTSVAAIGDLDEDGVVDLAVGAPEDGDIDSKRGAVWILFLNANGTVKSEAKITTLSGVSSQPVRDDLFGTSLASLGDLNGDGSPDIAVGAPENDTGGTKRGAVWTLFLSPAGTVAGGQKIASAIGGFAGVLDDNDFFGYALAGLGDVGDDGTLADSDLDADGLVDLAVGAPGDDDGGAERGALWVLHLAPDGSVDSHDKIAVGSSGFSGSLAKDDFFGASAAAIGDLDGDGVSEIAVGASLDDDGGGERGAVWVLFPEVCGNGIVSLGEQCDDGNREDGDCCSADCLFEASGSTCSDGNVCTDEQCNAAGSCVAVPNSGPCDDDVFCNGADTCDGSGACSIHAGDPCAGPDGDGNCSESCDEGLANCLAADPNLAACDDGLFCNGTDSCSAGICAGHGGDPCAGPDGDGNCSESCDEAADNCGASDPDDSPCDDGVFCNGTDVCAAGACSFHAGDPCTGGSACGNACDEGNQNCGVVDGSPCDDGLFCNGSDSCQLGGCSQHSGDPCPGADGDFDCAESCNEGGSDCLFPDPDGSSCEDALFCNGVDTCSGGNCASHAGDPCAGGPQCDDSCNEGANDCLTADGTLCDDGLFCTETDTCTGGACQGSTNPCGGTSGCSDTCNEGEGTCKLCGAPASGIYCLPNAVVTLRAAIALTTCDLCLCDVDGNGSILVTDALRILRVCVDLDPPPVACPAAFEAGGSTTSLSAPTTTSTLSPTER